MPHGSLGLVAALAGAACLVGAQEAAAGAKPIRLGQILPLTGEHVDLGLYNKEGAMLAVEQINRAGGINGRPLEIVLADDKSTNPGAVAALQRLLEDEDFVAIIGGQFSTQIQAMEPTVREAKVPFLMGGTNYGLTHHANPWVFRFRPNDGFSAKVVAKFTADELKLRRVAIVNTAEAFGMGGRDLVTQALKELGATPVIALGANPGEKDFTALLSSVKQSGADGLVTYMFTIDLGIMAKQMKQLGLAVTWVGSPSIVATDARRLAGDALYGTYGVVDFHADSSPAAKAFATAFRARFNQEADFLAAWSYDAVTVLADVLRRAPDGRPETLRKGLLAVRGFQGAEGEYNFDENGDGLDAYYIVKNDRDTIRYVRTIRIPRPLDQSASGTRPAGAR